MVRLWTEVYLEGISRTRDTDDDYGRRSLVVKEFRVVISSKVNPKCKGTSNCVSLLHE